MKIRASWLCVQTSVWLLASAFCVTSLAGCGATGNFTQGLGTDTAVQGLHGTVHGGPNSVVGATVTLYATTTENSPSAGNNYGYGEAGTVLGTATTDSNGNFAFSGTETACPAGQQAYIVAAGGKTGSNAANGAALLMDALGPCSSLVEGSSGTNVFINEPTTIAAAYALSGFMTVNGTSVDISAPANNNAATAACTVVSNATTACAASGLAHAFLNAANLVNPNTGLAYSASPSNATAVVPQSLIYTLANTVEACINSSGSGSTACTTLMTNTTPTIEVASPTAPTNTLEALLDLAQYPSMANGCSTAPTTPCAPGTGSGAPTDGTTVGGTVASAATTALFNIANSNAFYSPALTTVPLDFTIAIAYPETGALWGSAADIKDNIYVFDNTTPATVFSLSSNGVAGWNTAISATAGGGCGSYSYRCSVATDTLGNLWVVDSAGLYELTTAGVVNPTLYTSPTGDTLESGSVDMGNNVWLAAESIGATAGASGLEEFPRGGSAIVDVDVNGAPEPYAIKQPTFDSAGNLWAESDNTGGSSGPGAILMLSDTGSLTSPAFTNAGSGNGNPVYFPGGDATPGNGTMVDGSGNFWYSAQDDLLQVASSGSEANGGQNYTGPTAIYGPIYEAGVQRNAAMDGDGKIIIDATSTGAGYLSVFYPNAPPDALAVTDSQASGADVYINPCYAISGATTCAALAGGQSPLVNNPRSTTIDSTGAIWSAFQSAGFVIQVLGPGAPTWSQKSYIPHALAPNLLGNSTSLRPF